MKKKIFGLAAALLLTVGLTACGNNSDSKDSANKADDTILKVGASPTPHAEILEHVKPLLKDEGIDLEIVKFDDYVLPNQSLDEDVSELKDGATIITSNSESDWGRIITILQDAGLVKVKDGVDLETATFDDIAENPKNLKFNHTIDPSLLASTYQNDEGDLVAINANFAYGAGLNPLEDAVLLEKDNSPYVNIIATRKGDEDSDKIKKLIEVLHRKEVQEWITDKWGGSVKPVKADAK